MTIRQMIARVCIVLALATAGARAQRIHTITLVPPVDPVTKKYNEGKSCFSFKFARLKEAIPRDEGNLTNWDLGYGFLNIGGDDWFTLHFATRTVIRDLGKRDWSHPRSVPALEPLPPLFEDEPRRVTIDASADTHKEWARNTRNMARILKGHMYAVHIKTFIDDFYVLLRVDEHEQNQRCTISWRYVPAPAETDKDR